MAVFERLETERSLPTDRASYFTWEEAQPTRTEFLAGTLLLKPDVRREESLVTGNLLAKLHQHLRGSAFQTYGVQMKLEVDSADAVFYPDVMVSCDAADRRADLALRAPCLLVEVLSDSTAAFDRGAKFAAYRQVPSLQEYLLVDIETCHLELFRREAAGWVLRETTPTQPSLHLASITLDLSVGEVFEDLVDEPDGTDQA